MSIRPFYNAAERLFRSVHKRYDYPSCAPHATQAWTDYIGWIDSLCSVSREDLLGLRGRVVDYVLSQLPSQEFAPDSIQVQPPIFRIVLEEFDFSHKKAEPAGAAFQGAAFGFIRADNPHLQVEIGKVHTGGKRLQRIGDVDGWEGERLAISAEVKFRALVAEDRQDLAQFVDAVNQRGAIGMVIAESISASAEQAFFDTGLRLLDTSDLIRIVDLWDPTKQRIAVESMIYYVSHVEQNSTLKKRFSEFLKRVRPLA